MRSRGVGKVYGDAPGVAHLAGAGGDDYVTGFRAVSAEEAADVAQHGAFRPRPDGRSMDDKWFSETRSGAEQFQRNYQDLDRVVEARLPRDGYDRSYKNDNIDGTGPGFCVACEDISFVRPVLEPKK